jgi:hypothetical protein
MKCAMEVGWAPHVCQKRREQQSADMCRAASISLKGAVEAMSIDRVNNEERTKRGCVTLVRNEYLWGREGFRRGLYIALAWRGRCLLPCRCWPSVALYCVLLVFDLCVERNAVAYCGRPMSSGPGSNPYVDLGRVDSGTFSHAGYDMVNQSILANRV